MERRFIKGKLLWQIILALCLVVSTMGVGAIPAIAGPVPVPLTCTPNTGPTTGGTVVTITGTGLGGPTGTVTFGGVAATDVTNPGVPGVTPAYYQCTTPAHEAGVVDIIITNADGSGTLTGGFTYGSSTAPPTVTAVSPALDSTSGGLSVTISGTGFTDATAVTFGGTAATSYSVVSATQIIAVDPAGSAGIAAVAVTTANGTGSAELFTYTADVTVSSISPAGGKLAGGDIVTISGLNFTSPATVTFDASGATGLTVTARQIICTTPSHAAGAVTVTVAMAGGVGTGSFTYWDVPTIGSIFPDNGSEFGGTVVTITGTNYYSPATVKFGDNFSATVIVDNSTRIRATTPAGPLGPVNVAVTTNSGGPATLTGGYTYVLPVPTVVSCSPPDGTQSGGKVTTITGTNFYATPDLAVTFAGDPATLITVVDTTHITCTIPNYSPGVHVPGAVAVVVTCNGLTSTPVNAYTFLGNPAITSVSPSVGLLAGGTAVTVYGANFINPPNTLTFGGTAATSITWVDAGTYTCITPAHAAGIVDVIATMKGMTATGTGVFTFSDNTNPIVTGILPNVGSPVGGTLVTINGANFSGATAVNFGATAATSFSVVSASQITATAPAGTLDTTVDVTVTVGSNTSTTSTADQFTYTYAISIISITPAGGSPDGGDTITIIGANFVNGATVSIGSKACTDVTFVSSSQLTAVTPANIGSQDVTVTNPAPDSQTITKALAFTYYNEPTVSTLSPNTGSIIGGLVVTITGTNFYSPTTVKFGDNFSSTVIVDNATQIRATTPAGAALGAVNVVVTTHSLPAATVTGGFTYTAPTPTVSKVSPPDGSQKGGTTVTITGTNFYDTPTVTFGVTASDNVTVDNSTQIRAIAPIHAPASVDVVVTINGFSSAVVTASKFTYLLDPVVTSVSPSFGATAGGTAVTIYGANFIQDLLHPATVTFGGTTATSVTWVDNNTLTAITAVTTHAVGYVPVVVTQKACTGTLNDAFYFTDDATPVVTSISPVSGPLGGGIPVTINGRFFDNLASAVHFGSNTSSFSVVSGKMIVATVPGGSSTVDVTVTTAAGTSATSSADQFTYVPRPSVTSLSPNFGPTAGGTSVTINGTSFSGTTAVQFGSTAATSFSVNSDTQITATAPAGSAGSVDVTVTAPGGISDTSSADQFTYKPAPTVSALSVSSGPAAGGTTVIITGTNFLYGASKVSFGSADASFIVDSDTQITATSPAGTGTVNVTVTTEGGVSVTSSADQFTYIPAPAVSAISPVSGPITGSTSVTITGTNFTGATAVRFGSIAATSFSVNSDTQITAISPAGSVGTVDVTVTTAGGTSAISAADQFTYVGANVNITVTLQGGSRPDAGFVVPLTVKFFTPGTNVLTGTPTYTFELTTAKSGTFTAVATAIGVLPGTYDISAVTPTCLINEKKNVVVDAPSTNVNLGTLLEGDAITSGSSANVVNSQDFGALAASYNKSLGQSGYNDAADFDRSGKVNSQDFGLLAANYNKKGPVVLP